MSAELFTAEFLSLKHISTLIELGLGEKGPVSQQQLFANLNSVFPCSFIKFQSTVKLLHAIDLLCVDEASAVSLGGGLRSDIPFEELLGRLLLAGLKKNRLLTIFALVTQFSEKQRRLLVDGQALPWEYRGLRTLLIEAGFFIRESIYARHWTVASYAETCLFEEIRFKNDLLLSTEGFTPAQLNALLKARAGAGEEAERWVMEQEQARLFAHPLRDQIQWISKTNVSAGFDIASFRSGSSLIHDYFIEVKSFRSSPLFYWSKVEVDAARKLGDSYAICLVDRAKLTDLSYKPFILSNPFRRLLCEEQTQWNISTDTYLICAKSETGLGFANKS